MDRLWAAVLVAVTAFSSLTAIPAMRVFLRPLGIALCSGALGFFSLSRTGNAGEFSVLQLLTSVIAGLLISAPIVVMFELFSLSGRFIDLLRGSQFAEQMVGEERLSVLDGALSLIGVTVAVQKQGIFGFVDLLLKVDLNRNPLSLWSEKGIVLLLGQVSALLVASVTLVFPLLVYVVTSELVLGTVARVSKRPLLGSELRVIVSLLFLLALPERLSELIFSLKMP